MTRRPRTPPPRPPWAVTRTRVRSLSHESLGASSSAVVRVIQIILRTNIVCQYEIRYDRHVESFRPDRLRLKAPGSGGRAAGTPAREAARRRGIAYRGRPTEHSQQRPAADHRTGGARRARSTDDDQPGQTTRSAM